MGVTELISPSVTASLLVLLLLLLLLLLLPLKLVLLILVFMLETFCDGTGVWLGGSVLEPGADATAGDSGVTDWFKARGVFEWEEAVVGSSPCSVDPKLMTSSAQKATRSLIFIISVLE